MHTIHIITHDYTRSRTNPLGPIISSSAPLAHFTYHKGPITSIEWAPHDESVIAVSSADNQVTVWDLSVEVGAHTIKTHTYREKNIQHTNSHAYAHTHAHTYKADDDASAQANIDTNFPVADFPAQLLFIHQVDNCAWCLHIYHTIHCVLICDV